MHEVTDRLDPSPAWRNMSEQVPGDLAETIGLAVSASEQVDQAAVGQVRNGHLAGSGQDGIGFPSVLDCPIAPQGDVTLRRDKAAAVIAVEIDVGPGRDRWRRDPLLCLADMVRALAMGGQHAHHGGRHLTGHRDVEAIADQHAIGSLPQRMVALAGCGPFKTRSSSLDA